MTAIVKIIDDNGNTTGDYELAPSYVTDCGMFTKYVFEFEYNVLNMPDELRKAKGEE